MLYLGFDHQGVVRLYLLPAQTDEVHPAFVALRQTVPTTKITTAVLATVAQHTRPLIAL